MKSELTREQCQAACWKYEEMMDGARLPDGDGYDHEIVRAMFRAAMDVRRVDWREWIAYWMGEYDVVLKTAAYDALIDTAHPPHVTMEMVKVQEEILDRLEQSHRRVSEIRDRYGLHNDVQEWRNRALRAETELATTKALLNAELQRNKGAQ